MRTLLSGPIIRLLPLGLLFLSVQRTLFADHPVGGVKIQIVLALVVAAGAGGGIERGAVAGFALGLLYDLGGNTPLGLTALAYGVAGITAGYVHSITPDPRWWLATIFAAIGAVVGEAGIAVAEVFTGEDGWISTELTRTVSIVALAAAVLCPLLMPTGRWMMGVRRKSWKAIPE